MTLINFWDRNEGQIISTAGGIIVAILAAFLTYFLAKRQNISQERDYYQGILSTLHVELYWHNHHFDLLKKTLDKLESESIRKKSFLIERAPMQFNLSIIESSIENITGYKRFNPQLLALLTSYQNQIRNINYFLDFTNANEIIMSIENSQEKENRIADYFQVIRTEYIIKTQPVISDMRRIIEKKMNKKYRKKLILKE